MDIIEPSVEIIDNVNQQAILTKLEKCGRTAYKSEDRITEGSAEKFIKAIIKSGHGSVLEHVHITVKFICDRGVTHELVRHRLAAYTQESTRYCNYNNRGMTVIRPCYWTESDESSQISIWSNSMRESEKTYNRLIELGATPEEARAVLPNSLKSEIIVTMDIREWRHVLNLRTKPDCHPQIVQIMKMLLKEFKVKLPVLFGDIDE